MTATPKFSEDILASLRGRIAIVGNATPKRDFGKLIDSYDVVIRMNNFRLSGFERLIGTRTDLRCTTGWKDIETRHQHLEFSPFTADASESLHLANYNDRNGRPVLTARTDVHPFIPETPKPSAGLALVQLTALLGLPVDLFGFDGFRTPHYWAADRTVRTTHTNRELEYILKRDNVVLFGDAHPCETLSDLSTRRCS